MKASSRPVLAGQAVPTCTFDALWHVGTLNPKDKASRFTESYEGQGLSVSQDPDDWISIARLGGLPTWTLTKPGNLFLDHHALTDDQHAAIAAWGVDQGYVTATTVWRVTWWDSEYEQDLCTDLPTYQEALTEAREDENGEETAPVERTTLAATASFPDSTVQPGAIGIEQILTACWVAANLPDFDGVWWDDTYAPELLSCPRGVIHAHKVRNWTVRRA